MRNRSLENQSSVAEYFGAARADYSAAKRSQYRRQRTGVLPFGTHADWHIRVEIEFLMLREQARDFYRNDAVISSIVNRAATYTLQGGIRPDAKTGDPSVDKDLNDAYRGWSTSRDCSVEREFNLRQLERLTLQQTFVDGDICALPLQSGALQLMEAHRLRTPNKSKNKNVAFGVVLDPKTRERMQYWFTKEDVNPNSSIVVDDINPIEARDENDDLQVFHVYDPWRVTQTRGMTAFAPLFDTAGMVEDVNFATMVKHQVSACWATIRELSEGFIPSGEAPTGPDEPNYTPVNTNRTIQGIAPGMDVQGRPGEKISGFSPEIPSPQFEPHMRWMLTVLGINLGMPLVLCLMEPGGSFSAYRGAVDQAKMGFRRNQQWMVDSFHAPVRDWKLRQFCAENPALRAASLRLGPDFFNCKWHLPAWPYIDPSKDAQADLTRVRNCLAPISDVFAERGKDWDESYPRVIADFSKAISAARQAAIDMNNEFELQDGEKVHWREILPLPMPEGVLAKLVGADDSESGAEAPATNPHAGTV